MRTIHSLQLLRGLAACLVVYAHSIDLSQSLLASHSLQQNIFYLENVGAAGVDIFFVISGVIITLTSESITDVRSANRFAVRRFLRVAPYYWIMSIPFIMSAFSKGTFDWGKIFSTFMFFPFANGIHMPFLDVGWTLCFEMLFYLYVYIFKFLYVSSSYSRSIVIATLLIYLHFFASPDQIRLFFLSPFLFEFALGVFIALIYKSRINSVSEAKILGLLGLGGFALNLLFGFDMASEATYSAHSSIVAYRVFVFGLPSAFLVLSLLSMESMGVDFRCRLEIIGDASFSIYLTHLSVFAIIKRFILPDWVSPDFFILIVFILAMLIGMVSYHALEKPILEVLNGRLFRQIKSNPA